MIRAVLPVEFFNVRLTHRIPLADRSGRILWNNCPLPVAGEGLVRIVHDTAVIVGKAKGATRLMLDEIVPLSQLYVVPDNLHVFIAIRRGLLMEEPEGVNKFMDYRSLPHAPLADRVSLQIQVLHFPLVPHLRVTASVFTLQIPSN